MFGRRAQRWEQGRRGGGRPVRRVVVAVAGGGLGVLVATAMMPAIGVMIAVLFWTVLAAWVAALALPALRWAAPHARVAAAWAAVRVAPVADARLRRWATGWQITAARIRLWARGGRPAWAPSGPATVRRAITPGLRILESREPSGVFDESPSYRGWSR